MTTDSPARRVALAEARRLALDVMAEEDNFTTHHCQPMTVNPTRQPVMTALPPIDSNGGYIRVREGLWVPRDGGLAARNAPKRFAEDLEPMTDERAIRLNTAWEDLRICPTCQGENDNPEVNCRDRLMLCGGTVKDFSAGCPAWWKKTVLLRPEEKA